MDAPLPFSDREIAFLDALVAEGVEFLIVGLAAAALQGAPAVTQGVEFWFRDLTDAALRRALLRVGVTCIPPTASTPPLFAGGGTELFDIVVHMHGLDDFASEARRAERITLGRVVVPVLSLDRIIVSKRATGRPKDLSILPALEDTLRAKRGTDAIPRNT